MGDYSELKARAEAAVGFDDVPIAPDVILALIAENERLERKNANQSESIREYQDLVMGGDVSLGMLKADLRVTTGERDQLKAENERLTAELDCPFRLARHSKRLVEKLQAENEALRKISQSTKIDCLVCGLYHGGLPCPSTRPYAAMGKGEQS